MGGKVTRTELFCEIGAALWGSRWQSDMGAALEISDRHIRRMVSGEAAIPPGVFVDLMRIMQERAQALDDLTAQAATFGG